MLVKGRLLNYFNTPHTLQWVQKKHSAVTNCDHSSGVSKNYTRQRATQEASTKHVCFFCGDEDTVDTLHEAATFGLNKKVSKGATDLQDQQLLAKLSAGDLIAQDAGCLVSLCLVTLYYSLFSITLQQSCSRASPKRQTEHNWQPQQKHCSRWIANIGFIDESRMNEAPVFMLADLIKLYSARLQQLKHCARHSSTQHWPLK